MDAREHFDHKLVGRLNQVLDDAGARQISASRIRRVVCESPHRLSCVMQLHLSIMWTSTVILSGTVVVEGTAFRWLVTDSLAQKLTVSHPTLGSKTEALTGSPESQSRDVGRSILVDKARSAAIGFVDAFDDAPLPDRDPEPTIV
jgi:2-methylaconitate cis-trans-isomerase PrpF